MFYIIIFSLLAVLLVVAGIMTITRRRTRLEAEERRSAVHTAPARRKRKEARAQSRNDRRKRH